MLKVLSYILCDLDPKVKVIGQKAGICDGVPSTSALVLYLTLLARGDFCCLLITFANSLDPDQARQNVGPDLDPNCLTP